MGIAPVDFRHFPLWPTTVATRFKLGRRSRPRNLSLNVPGVVHRPGTFPPRMGPCGSSGFINVRELCRVPWPHFWRADATSRFSSGPFHGGKDEPEMNPSRCSNHIGSPDVWRKLGGLHLGLFEVAGLAREWLHVNRTKPMFWHGG